MHHTISLDVYQYSYVLVLMTIVLITIADVAKEALNRSYDFSDDTRESEIVYNYKLLDKHYER